jgi:hypothetical protein
MKLVANRNFTDFGWEIAHAALLSRRPPISLYTMVPRTGSYSYFANVWDQSIVQGPFSVARAKNERYDSQLLPRCMEASLPTTALLSLNGCSSLAHTRTCLSSRPVSFR